jgi:hypothetical protein
MLVLIFHSKLILVILTYFTQRYFQLFFWLFKVIFGYLTLTYFQLFQIILNYLMLDYF